MNATCPKGHASSADDYCDVCGALIDVASARHSIVRDPTVELATASEPCPVCGEARTEGERFCEGCGLDFDAPRPAPVPAAVVEARWELRVTADRARYERLRPAGVEFPYDTTPWTWEIDAPEITIGRSSRSASIDPDLDLSEPVEDPGVSHEHARLLRGDDGCYSLIDDDSTNGTKVNGEPLEAGRERALVEGDVVQIGLWTDLTLRRIEVHGDDGA
jgi:hypothetical protein